jgi:hypothetical protein
MTPARGLLPVSLIWNKGKTHANHKQVFTLPVWAGCILPFNLPHTW